MAGESDALDVAQNRPGHREGHRPGYSPKPLTPAARSPRHDHGRPGKTAGHREGLNPAAGPPRELGNWFYPDIIV